MTIMSNVNVEQDMNCLVLQLCHLAYLSSTGLATGFPIGILFAHTIVKGDACVKKPVFNVEVYSH